MVPVILMPILLPIFSRIHPLISFIRPMNRINPPHRPETPIEKLMMPIMKPDPSTDKRNKCIARMHRRRLNQFKRHENPKRHNMRMQRKWACC